MPLRAFFIEEVTQSCTARKVNVGRIAEKVSPFRDALLSVEVTLSCTAQQAHLLACTSWFKQMLQCVVFFMPTSVAIA